MKDKRKLTLKDWGAIQDFSKEMGKKGIILDIKTTLELGLQFKLLAEIKRWQKKGKKP